MSLQLILENVLQKYDRQNSVVRILETVSEPAAGKGDNYSSEIVRVKMKCLMGSGKIIEKSVILKTVMTGEQMVKWSLEGAIFKREIEMLHVILPNMESLMKEFNDTNEILWPNLIDYKPYTEIIMEDLKEKGYIVSDRHRGLNLEQSLLTVRSIGRWHAMSVILKDRYELDPSLYKQYILTHDESMIKGYNVPALKIVSDMIINEWEPEWKDIGERMRKMVPMLWDKLSQLGIIDENRFNVLNHGDMWAPNILFKYAEGNPVPISIRFIDFQMSAYNTYALDLYHLIYSSVSRSVRIEKFDTLLQAYHYSLLNTFQRMKYKPRNLPTFDDVLMEMRRFSTFGFLVASTVQCILTSEPADALDFTELLQKQDLNNIIMSQNIFREKYFIECLKDALPVIMKNGGF